jgi:hypothetical protein
MASSQNTCCIYRKMKTSTKIINSTIPVEASRHVLSTERHIPLRCKNDMQHLCIIFFITTLLHQNFHSGNFRGEITLVLTIQVGQRL